MEGVVRVSLSGILFSMLSARKGDGGRGGGICDIRYRRAMSIHGLSC